VAHNAPPVPTIPVMKPEIPPSVIVVLVFAANFSEDLSKNKTENAIKDIFRTREAPRKLSSMLGIPNVIIIFLSNNYSCIC
jgi:hypothetical protein